MLISFGRPLRSKLIDDAVACSLLSVATKRWLVDDLGQEIVKFRFEGVEAAFEVTNFGRRSIENTWSQDLGGGFYFGLNFLLALGIRGGITHNLPLLELTYVFILF